MKIQEAQHLAISYMELHNLKDWTFNFHGRKSQLGTCSYKSKTIYLSRLWVETLDEKEILDTILHEIAHALVGPRS
jgi:predicted SprT family Zn-dependent metalloprotease